MIVTDRIRSKSDYIAGIEENEGVYNYDIFEVNVDEMDYPFLK